MEGPINMNGQSISGLNAPTEDTQAANKGYVDVLKDNLADAWTNGKTYAVGDYCISGNQLYKCKTAHTSGSTFNQTYWEATSITYELSKRLNSNKISFVTKTVISESNKKIYDLGINWSEYTILSVASTNRFGWSYYATTGVSGTESMTNWALIFDSEPNGTFDFRIMLYKL